jgi:N-acetylmuramic acid 6-phosphate etherase
VKRSDLFEELEGLATEQRNPYSMEIDTASVRESLEIINSEDQRVPLAVRREIPYIEEAVKIVVEAFKNDARLIYIGAGTSGRLGILDASEMPPTFGTPPEMVQGLIAGGREAMFTSQEGAEDVEDDGARDLREVIDLQPDDVVCGIAASRRTPYVIGGVKYAHEIGCKTLYVTCNPRSEFDIEEVDVAMCPVVGPEVIMGSTRMKSGTAQKLTLNMITTAAMVQVGKVYENMMIDLQMTSKKLQERSKRTVMTVTGVDYAEASEVLGEADGHVKTAIVMILAGVGADEARRRLDAHDGFARPAIEDEGAA